MKRAIALLLVPVMLFALCGCGNSKELTEEEKEKIYEEMQQQKEKENKEETAASEQEYDVIVEDCAKSWEREKSVMIKPRVHNCTDTDATYLSVYCALIDKEGRTIRVATCDGIGGVVAGASEWVAGQIEISNDEISKLAELRFSGGSFDVSKDGKMYSQTVRFAETSFSKEYVFGE